MNSHLYWDGTKVAAGTFPSVGGDASNTSVSGHDVSDANVPSVPAGFRLDGGPPLPPKGFRLNPSNSNDKLDALIGSIWHIESSGRRHGVPDSKAGAIGPMQIMPQTATRLTGLPLSEAVAYVHDDENNIAVGRRYLVDLYHRYGGDAEAVAVAYNAGEKRADHWLASGRDTAMLPKETKNYLKSLSGNLGRFAGPQPEPDQADDKTVMSALQSPALPTIAVRPPNEIVTPPTAAVNNSQTAVPHISFGPAYHPRLGHISAPPHVRLGSVINSAVANILRSSRR
jgi:hypothetical protein